MSKKREHIQKKDQDEKTKVLTVAERITGFSDNELFNYETPSINFADEVCCPAGVNQFLGPGDLNEKRKQLKEKNSARS